MRHLLINRARLLSKRATKIDIEKVDTPGEGASTATLQKIYDEIDKLETTEVETKKYVQIEELLAWAVWPGLGLLLLEMLLGNTVWRKLP